MSLNKVRELIIPACEGLAFEVSRGEVFRIIDPEGNQVGDMIAYNPHNFKERFSAILTSAMNKSYKKITKMYTSLPWGNEIFTVTDDPVGLHWCSGGRCNRLMYRLRFGLEDHKNCQDILAGCIKPYGLEPWEVGEVFNIFMNVRVDENGGREILAPHSKAGDYIELRAAMDALVVIAACPDDLQPVNGLKPTPLKVEVYA